MLLMLSSVSKSIARRLALPLLVVASCSPALLAGTEARADADRARQFFGMCASCHGKHGEGNATLKAPPIAGLPEWYLKAQLDKFRNGARASHPRDLVGLRMRPIGRTLDDADTVLMAGYVSALPAQPQPETIKGSLVKGEGTYQVCQACHGPKAEGNQQLGAPPLITNADWYLYDQLVKFKAAIRGGDAAVDPVGASMQGIATTLDEEAMKNVVSYINALKPAP